MDEYQLLELKGLIEKRFIFDLIREARKIDVSEFKNLRFVLEFNFDEKGLVADAGVEVRYRRSLKA